MITANGAGIASLGVVVRDSAGGLVRRDNVRLPAPFTSNVKQGVALNLPISMQGKRLAITAFAVDQIGRTGYAVRASTSPVETILANAIVDSTQIVFGQTYQLPLPGTVATSRSTSVVATSSCRTRSTTASKSGRTPRANSTLNGIPVGSLPWGLFVSATNPDTLLVANSGGTNISRVFIGSSSVPALHEDLPNRLLTRNIYLHEVLESRDPGTGKITASLSPIISYSDRPQYLAQSSTGRIYFSTMPTGTAPEGTIRLHRPVIPGA